MGENRVTMVFPNKTGQGIGFNEAVPDQSTASEGGRAAAGASDRHFGGEMIVPAVIWASGILYSAYYTGEVLRVFDIADVLVSRWLNGQLDIPSGKAAASLDRLYRKSARRNSSTVRGQLYRRVFGFGQMETAGSPPSHFSFESAWERLMRGAAGAVGQRARAENEPDESSWLLISQATRDLQRGLTASMAGSAYLMATEVATQLRESLDLLGCAEIIEHSGEPGRGMFSVVERVSAELFDQSYPAARVHALANAGCQILQNWVAPYDGLPAREDRLRRLLEPASAWNEAWSALMAEGGLPDRLL